MVRGLDRDGYGLSDLVRIDTIVHMEERSEATDAHNEGKREKTDLGGSVGLLAVLTFASSISF